VSAFQAAVVVGTRREAAAESRHLEADRRADTQQAVAAAACQAEFDSLVVALGRPQHLAQAAVDSPGPLEAAGSRLAVGPSFQSAQVAAAVQVARPTGSPVAETRWAADGPAGRPLVAAQADPADAARLQEAVAGSLAALAAAVAAVQTQAVE